MKATFFQGLRDGAPFILVIVPFALLFGAVVAEAGYSLAVAMGFSVAVIAGAAQFTAIQLLNDQAPAVIVVLSALAVNLRMAMYSASMAPHFGMAPLWMRLGLAYLLVDQTYAMASLRFPQEPEWGLREKVAYYLGVGSNLVPLWYLFTGLGHSLGARIPEALALDFALPILFLAMVGPMLRTGAHVVAASVASLLSVALIWVPHVGLILAAAGGMAAGAWVEARRG